MLSLFSPSVLFNFLLLCPSPFTRVWLNSCPLSSLPGSSVHGISQARIQEWVYIPFPWDLPDPGIEPGSPALQADYLLSESPGKLILYKQCTVYMCVCIYLSIKSVQFSRSVMSDSLDCNIPGYPVHHHLPELL